MPVVRSARAIVHGQDIGIFDGCAGQIALGILNIQTLRPGPVCQQAEGTRHAVLDGGDQAVVVCRGLVVDDDRTTAAALILVPAGGLSSRVRTRRILLGEQEARVLVPGGGAVAASRSGLDGRGSRGHDARTARSARTPHTGDEHSRVEWVANWIVPRGVANIVERCLPAMA